MSAMKPKDCDLLVVGAGPAGASAALEAARRGLRVLVAERKEAVGTPVRCAEYIPAPLVGELGLGRGFIVQAIRGMRTILPTGEIQETRAPGFTVCRDILDRTIAEAAKKAGAEIRLSTGAVGRRDDAVFLRRKGEPAVAVRAKVILGADGPHTTVGRWMGSVNGHLMPAVQVRVSLRRPMDQTEVYFLPEIFAGYGWLFPRGNVANVGIGMKPAPSGRTSLPGLLMEFTRRLARQGKVEPKPLSWVAGWIPVGPPRRIVSDNMMLAGDAAGHTHPITGAGIQQAVAGGRMAGRWAAAAVEAGDLGALSRYEAEWRDLFQETLDRGYRRRLQMEGAWDRLPQTIRQCWVAFREYYAGS